MKLEKLPYFYSKLHVLKWANLHKLLHIFHPLFLNLLSGNSMRNADISVLPSCLLKLFETILLILSLFGTFKFQQLLGTYTHSNNTNIPTNRRKEKILPLDFEINGSVDDRETDERKSSIDEELHGRNRVTIFSLFFRYSINLVTLRRTSSQKLENELNVGDSSISVVS